MEVKFKIKLVVCANGERYPILLDKEGRPHYDVALYATTQLRNASKAPNTIIATLTAIRILLSWADFVGINLRKRFSQKDFLREHELETLRRYAESVAEGTNSKSIGASVRNIESARKHQKLPTKRIRSTTLYTRLIYIARYLEWFALRCIEERGARIEPESLDCVQRMANGLRARCPTRAAVSRENARKGLTKEQQRILQEAIEPQSLSNPFSCVCQVRNHIATSLLLHLGLRAGELLALRVSDFDFQQNTLLIARRHDNSADPRGPQPVVKTFDRRIPVADWLMKAVSDYVIKQRALLSSAKKHEYLLVVHQKGSHQGHPLSAKGLDKIFQKLRQAYPSEIGALTPHILRHTANDRLSALMDERGVDAAKEEKMRSYLMGWKEGSGTAATYTRRHIEDSAHKAALILQDKMKEYSGC